MVAVRPIIQLGNPSLRQPSRPVRQEELADIHDLALDMFDTLLHFRQQSGYGRGIAAPQVGINKRLVVIAQHGQPQVMINPRFIKRSEEKITVWDSCFSCPGLWYKVDRHRNLTVEYRDLNWQLHLTEAENNLAELLQHELDHLDGRMAIDLVTDSSSFCTTDEYFTRYWEDNRE